MSIDEQTTAIHVLLVEDNDHDRIAFGRALEKSGMPFKLTWRQRAEDLLKALNEANGGIDVVVMDYDLPGSNGLEAYRSMAHRPGLPPFVMLTGVGSERLAVEALKAGMFDYIVKDPYTYRRLLPLKIRDVTQRHRDRLDAKRARRKLQQAHQDLEKLVDERTTELALLVEALKVEIEERRKTEKALRRSERELRRLSRKTVETQENERRLVAKELHDSIGSSLAAIKFAVEEKLAGMPADPPPGKVSLEIILDHLRDTIKEVRRISSNLRPSILDDLGLLATVTWHCRKSGELQSDIRIDTTFDVREEEIPELNKIVIYRVMQEALHNALRHSRAQRVHVRLEKRDDSVRLCVTDDGCGFDLETENDRPDALTGYGLRGMYDRAEVVGGRLSIDARIDEGTAVCLDLPCDSEAAHHAFPA